MAPKKDEPEVIAQRLADLRDEASEDLQHYFLTFEDYWERKLWHELTDILQEFYLKPESASQRIPLFVNFVTTFAEKLSQLRLVEIGLNAALQLKGIIVWALGERNAFCADLPWLQIRTSALSF